MNLTIIWNVPFSEDNLRPVEGKVNLEDREREKPGGWEKGKNGREREGGKEGDEEEKKRGKEMLDERKRSSVEAEELVADYQLAMMIGSQLAAEKAPRQLACLSLPCYTPYTTRYTLHALRCIRYRLLQLAVFYDHERPTTCWQWMPL